jgi:CheY-like chemotaxis protein
MLGAAALAPPVLSRVRPAMTYTSASPTAVSIDTEPELEFTPSPSASRRSEDTRAVTRQRVLLLEDDDEFREVVNDFLISRFYAVTAVRDGAEGLREILKEPFDLIVCDMMMPQVNGEMFYWAVSRLRPAARLRFLFITGFRNDPKVESFFQRVNATVLPKPFTLDALNTALIDIARKVRG